jgi:amino acid transporter
MARWRALPAVFGKVSAKYQTPTVSTIAMGAVSAVWYVTINQLSTNVLADSVTAIGFMIAFYYGFTGLACVIYYRKSLLRSVKNFVFVGVLPLLGFLMLALVFYKAYIDYGTKGFAQGFTSSPPLLGVEVPVFIGIGGLVLGLVLMGFFWATDKDGFFARRPEVADAEILERPASTQAVVTQADAEQAQPVT